MAEKEYIEREAAIKRFNFAVLDCLGMEPTIRAGDIIKALESIPAADVREVKRGKWKRVVDLTGVEAFGYKETMLVGYGCNVCGYEVDVSEGNYNFCPNCGADMREVDNAR